MTTVLRAPTVWVAERPAVRRLITERRLGRRFAGRFVAGNTLEAGMEAARALDRLGIAAMLDHLGEHVEFPAQAAEATDAYIRALKSIRESPHIDCNISVKLTQLGLDSSRDLCRENMERVLQAATNGERPILVMIDMEARAYVDRTIDLYAELRDRYPNVGICVQAYLNRTVADAARLAGSQAIVRVCKGAYLEPPDVAYRTRREVARNFARVAATLFSAGSTVHVATHDPRLLEGARSFLRTERIRPSGYEFQMLYGIRRDLQAELVRRGDPIRVYVPYGNSWYPYLTRRMAERPANIWFFLSNALRRGG